MQIDFISKRLKSEVTQRFRAGDLPTTLQAALQLFNFGKTAAVPATFDVWHDIALVMENNISLSAKVTLPPICLMLPVPPNC